MTVITTRLTVTPEGSISAAATLPAGEHVAQIEVHQRPQHWPGTLAFDADELPVHDLGPWPGQVPLRREELYSDEGR